MPEGVPFPLYPRPQLRRPAWVDLNGPWQYAITAVRETPGSYDGTILVPFSPEAPLSGVNRQLLPGQWLHYRRTFAPPPGQGGRVLLHFGAVDWRCTAAVNGQNVGGHTGGYLPFTLDITAALHDGENELTLAVEDPSETHHQARGKQRLDRGGMFYTAQSGIWQTVWLERVPENYVKSIKITPLLSKRRVRVELKMADDTVFSRVNMNAVVRKDGAVIAEDWTDEAGAVELRIGEEHLRPWSPEDPFLYDLAVTTPDETVYSYFALREFTAAPDANGILRFCLNGRPYLQHGLLDQGYWPGGLYTPPDEDAMVRDIRLAKSLGFNMLRKHVKVEPDRWYYWCDRLGMLVWQDMPNGGGQYRHWFVTNAINLAQPLLRRFPDGDYRLFAREDAAERAAYYAELEALVRHLYSHPCVCGWVPFNEGWGQFDAPKATARVHALDPTRPVDEASGWFDEGGGEVWSLHNYFYPLRVRPRPPRVVALTEYGGIAWACPGHITREKVYGYGTAKSAAQLTARYRKLLLQTVLPQLKNGLSALVYTQLSDVEDEVNGVVTYDRAVTKLDAAAARAAAAALFREFARCTAPKGEK